LGTRISKNFDFLSAVYFEGKFLINSFDISLTLSVETDSINEQNVAMDRIKYFITERLENCVFAQDTETKVIEKYQAAGLKVCSLPEEPYDQIITILLLHKLNAICEGKLIVTDIHLESILSDGVGFMYDIDDMKNLYQYKNGWWTENSNTISNNVSGKKEKIVRLIKNNDWVSLGLDWASKENCSEIIFAPDLEK
jgi:hypothetical protein